MIKSKKFWLIIGVLSMLMLLSTASIVDAQRDGGRQVAENDSQFSISVVVKWNEAMLAAIRNGPPRPTVISRSLFMVHAAMYDAWSMYDEAAIPVALDADLRRPTSEHTLANKEAAVSQAAYYMLTTLFPEYEVNSQVFVNLLFQLGYTPVETQSDLSTAEEIGYLAAQAVLDARAEDGSNYYEKYAQITSDMYPSMYTPVNSANPYDENSAGHSAFDPNRWQPLRVPTGYTLDENYNPIAVDDIPDSYVDQAFLTPHWGSVTPFALARGDEYRPAAPPQAGSDEPYTDALGHTMTNDEAYNEQVNQVLQISATLTDAQKVTAEYWADGPRSETPPGHWNALAHGISWRDQHTIDQDIQMYFALNGALLDASIAAWDAKRTYDYIRPASAIRNMYAGQPIRAWGGPNQGPQTMLGEQWLPYQAINFVTPPFAEYVSGHSTFSMAAAEILTRFTSSNTFYDGVTIVPDDFNQDGIHDMLGQHIAPVGSNKFENSPSTIVILQWDTFQDAANEAGISRLYGGIHFQDGDLNGRELGRRIGNKAFDVAEMYWNGDSEEIQRIATTR